MWLYHRVMSPDGMANSVDSDQTAPLGAVYSSLIWVCTVCPDLSVRKLRNITIHLFHICLKGISNKTYIVLITSAVGSESDCESRGRWLESRSGHILSWRFFMKNVYGHSPPSTDSRRADCSFWRKYVH